MIIFIQAFLKVAVNFELYDKCTCQKIGLGQKKPWT